MSEIKALEKLRESSHLDDSKWSLETGEVIHVFGYKPEDPNAVNWGEQWRKIADEIQNEVDSRFCELPVDANGVPWTLETESFVDDTGAKVVFSGLEVDYAGRWRIRSNCVLHDPSLCRHVKPDPLKELLNDRINDVLSVMTSGIPLSLETVLNDSFGEECADEIRELMKEGGDD